MLYSLKNFAITFLVAALLFGVVAYFVSGFLMKTVADPLGVDEEVLDRILSREGEDDTTDLVSSDETDPPASTDENGVPFDTDPAQTDDTETPDGTAAEVNEAVAAAAKLKGDSFTALLIGTDYRPDDFDDYVEAFKSGSRAEYGVLSRRYRTVEADTILLVRVDKERGEFMFMNIPSYSYVLSGTQYFTLAELYSMNGRDYLIRKVEAMTGMTVDCYGVLNITELPAVLDELGGITYNVPYDIYKHEGVYYRKLPEGATGSPILTKGKQQIESKAIIPLVSFWQYPGGIEERVQNCLAIARAMLAKLTVPGNLLKLPDIYSHIKSAFDTNVTLEFITDHAELLFAYDKLDTVILTYPGYYTDTGDGLIFTPDISRAVEMLRPYK